MNKLKINVETNFPVAFESPDHLIPWGTARDNSKNYRFNQKINKLFDSVKKPLKILDLGCSGGGFIADSINDGHIAVGLEGSDYSLNIGRAEWSRIPNYLFTCDITKLFTISIIYKQIKQLFKCDIITSWEIMEHIKTEDLEQVASNVDKHLINNGLWIMSISSMDDFINGVNLHQTVKPRVWWIMKFESLGFYHQEKLNDYFNGQYIRSDKYGAPSSFNLILSKNKIFNLNIPKLSYSQKIFDYWIGSSIQKKLMKIVNGPNSYS
jgi:2-polyprenyl-3-methyl-5-hydroxy-6-metoxy-1,4-benzoquinol methylase